MLMSVMTVLELNRLGINSAGVDEFYFHAAKRDNKKIETLESIEQQVNFLAAVGVGNEEQFIQYLLDSLTGNDAKIAAMITAWQQGNLSSLVSASEFDDLRNRFPQVYKTLMTNRNNRWLPIIEEMFEDPDTELILVGALHMAKQEGLIQLLEDKGYQITPISYCMNQ